MFKVKYLDFVAGFMENMDLFCTWPNNRTHSFTHPVTQSVYVRGTLQGLRPLRSDANHSSTEKVRNSGTNHSLHIHPYGMTCTRPDWQSYISHQTMWTSTLRWRQKVSPKGGYHACEEYNLALQIIQSCYYLFSVQLHSAEEVIEIFCSIAVLSSSGETTHLLLNCTNPNYHIVYMVQFHEASANSR
jgi:hypothetical protein